MLRAVPWKRWPTEWHILLASLVLTMALAASATSTSAARQKVTQSDARLTTARAELALLQSPRATAPASNAVLADITSRDAVLRDIASFADTAGVQLATVQTAYETGPASAYKTIRFAVQARGSYGAVKIYLAELLARYPSLYLSSLLLQHGGAAEGGQLQATLSLALLVRANQ